MGFLMKIAIVSIFFLLFLAFGVIIETTYRYVYFTEYAEEEVVCDRYENGRLYDCKVLYSYPVRGYAVIKDPGIVTRKRL